jgi:hypothetical protein
VVLRHSGNVNVLKQELQARSNFLVLKAAAEEAAVTEQPAGGCRQNSRLLLLLLLLLAHGCQLLCVALFACGLHGTQAATYTCFMSSPC